MNVSIWDTHCCYAQGTPLPFPLTLIPVLQYIRYSQGSARQVRGNNGVKQLFLIVGALSDIVYWVEP